MPTIYSTTTIKLISSLLVTSPYEYLKKHGYKRIKTVEKNKFRVNFGYIRINKDARVDLFFSNDKIAKDHKPISFQIET
jgi:hypothetical protein